MHIKTVEPPNHNPLPKTPSALAASARFPLLHATLTHIMDSLWQALDIDDFNPHTLRTLFPKIAITITRINNALENLGYADDFRIHTKYDRCDAVKSICWWAQRTGFSDTVALYRSTPFNAMDDGGSPLRFSAEWWGEGGVPSAGERVRLGEMNLREVYGDGWLKYF
ncbi:hypothetical protein MMC14_006430 [Varicellaria rhodocarpa]|nr:hypothetical protein [Varicellaria rhodocarpa]